MQITLAESFGTQGRAGFYDGVGAARDVLQNHMLQIVALLAMEPPIALDADSLRDEEVKVLRQVAPMQRGRTVRGQYAGYTAEPGVRGGSNTETFVATEFTIDSWRWAGVPFHLRTGKHLPIDATEAVIEFRSPPQTLFRRAGGADAMSKGRTCCAYGLDVTTASVSHCRSRPQGRRQSARP